jgi:predicted patatin/cPLA2 family phospholipase
MRQAESVISVVKERRELSSQPYNRSDEFKVGLAIDSGGMRGLISMSMLNALEGLGYRNSFDGIYGSSAGAIVGSYFAAEQSMNGVRDFLYEVPCKGFIDFKRPLKGKSVVSIGFLVNEVLRKDSLDWERVRDSNVPINMVAASAETKESVIFNHFVTEEDVFGALFASAWIPRAAGLKPRKHKEQKFWDGATVDATGVLTALKDGCTHVLALKNKQTNKPPRVRESGIEEIHPNYSIGRLEKRPQKLQAAVRAGAWAVIKAFSANDDEISMLRARYHELDIEL